MLSDCLIIRVSEIGGEQKSAMRMSDDDTDKSSQTGNNYAWNYSACIL